MLHTFVREDGGAGETPLYDVALEPQKDLFHLGKRFTHQVHPDWNVADTTARDVVKRYAVLEQTLQHTDVRKTARSPRAKGNPNGLVSNMTSNEIDSFREVCTRHHLAQGRLLFPACFKQRRVSRKQPRQPGAGERSPRSADTQLRGIAVLQANRGTFGNVCDK